jgi:hypothetical protein
MLLQVADGCVDVNLASNPGGLEDRLLRTFGSTEGDDGLWNRGNDKAADAQMELNDARITYPFLKKGFLSMQWGSIIYRLVEHHQEFACVMDNS